MDAFPWSCFGFGAPLALLRCASQWTEPDEPKAQFFLRNQSPNLLGAAGFARSFAQIGAEYFPSVAGSTCQGRARSAKQLIHSQHWSVYAPSRNVFFTVPLRPRIETPMPTILLVDDDLSIRTLLGFFLRKLGCTVLFAADGETALSLYREGIDLVLLDLEMPGLNGPRTCRALQKIDPEVRCCLLTGHAASSVEEGEALGVLAIFTKPLVGVERFCKELCRLATRDCVAV
jgi:CheY-like chemotaxis protein